jgi:hypothetical protein
MKTLIFSSKRHCDHSAAFQKKSSLPAHVGVRAIGKLGFFDYFGNLYHAYALGIDGNARSHAGMFGIRRTYAYVKDYAKLRVQALS